MTRDEVRALLAYASATDPRVRRNDPGERDLQVAAWETALADLAPQAAREAVDEHYSTLGVDAVLPGDILGRVPVHALPTPTPAETGTGVRIHCPRPSCRCTHTDGCVGGWIDVWRDGKEWATPCPTCKWDMSPQRNDETREEWLHRWVSENSPQRGRRR